MPQPVGDLEILNTLDAEAMYQTNHIKLVSLLELAMIISAISETSVDVDDFTVMFFIRYLSYVG